jgi:glycosyltransferase involved in cell wall biosynthesis
MIQNQEISNIEQFKSLKVAVIHEWLVTYAGAERVLEQILKIFPNSTIFSLIDFLPESERGFLQGRPVKTSFVQTLPLAEKHYRQYLPLFPLAIEQFDLTGFDLVISSQYCVSHGVITGPEQPHISYVHSPMRYAWDLYHQYMHESGLDKKRRGWAARYFLHNIRQWDTMASRSVDSFIANSKFVAKRVKKYYGKPVSVINPPVDIDAFQCCTEKDDYYVTASRMVPYKKIDLIAAAFTNMPNKKLIIVGDGPDYKKIKSVAGPNIQFLGHAPFDVLKKTMQNAKAFVFAAEEDFGITPVEAQACGTPVIAFGAGGALETVQGLDSSELTGVFFKEQTMPSLIDGITRFEANEQRFTPQRCRNNALRFSTERFNLEFTNYVTNILNN